MNQSFSYDRLASVYDLLSYAGFLGKIQQAQRCYLSEIPPDAHVLFIGGGTGWLLSSLFNTTRIQHITYVEASEKMILKAEQMVIRFQRKYPKTPLPQITFTCGTEQQISPSGKYDVAITNFLLDMYSGQELIALIERISQHLSPQAKWLFSDFQLSQQPHQRIWQRPLIGLMYYFFNLTAGIAIQPLPEFSAAFSQVGWQVTRRSTFFGNFIVSEIYQKTKDVIPDALAEDNQGNSG